MLQDERTLIYPTLIEKAQYKVVIMNGERCGLADYYYFCCPALQFIILAAE